MVTSALCRRLGVVPQLALIVAAFDARTGSGDFWMPSKHIPGKKVSVHGTPAKSIEGGVPTTTHPWIVAKFESEALTLSAANQAMLWSSSEKDCRTKMETT